MKRRLLAFIAVLAVLGAACTQERVNEAEIGVHYTDGEIEGKHFEDVIEPGGSVWVFNDHVYKLPARQITWITGPGGEADASSLEFTAAGGERMIMELSTRFQLNTTMDEDQEPFKTFFTGICQSFDCWEGSIDNEPGKDKGWNRMLNQLVGNPQRAAAVSVGLGYDAELLRYDTATQDAFADAFAEEFQRLLTDEVGVSGIFCGPGYERGDTSCPPIGVKVTKVRFADDARELIREQQRLAEEQVNLAETQRAAAVAQQQVNEVRATDDYLRLQQAEAMVACAQNPECTLVVNVNGGSLDVTVPAG